MKHGRLRHRLAWGQRSLWKDITLMTDEAPKNPPPALPTAQILDILSCGEMQVEHGLMRYSSNYTFLITIVQGEHELMAIYKPQRGERPLWDFAEGTLCHREVASFLTSEALGWGLIPPTVLREGIRGLGSVQLCIDHDPDDNYFNFSDQVKQQLPRFALFDFVVNNADRKGGHCLLDVNQRVWAIDHGITFHTAHKLRTVIWDYANQPIEDQHYADLEALAAKLSDADTPYRKALLEHITEAEVRACEARLRRLLKTRKYPIPGSGPNHPWPPV
jgi:hypothetical protein